MKDTFGNRGIIILVLFLTSVSFSGFKLQAQEVNRSEVVLEIQKKDKTKEIKIGRKIRIWYECEKHKGRIDSITPNSIFIGEKEFIIAKIDKIGIKFKGTQITGAILGTMGTFASSLGGVMIIKAYSENTKPLDGIFLVIGGAILEIIGIPILTIGSSMFFIGKKYKKRKGWSYKSVQVY